MFAKKKRERENIGGPFGRRMEDLFSHSWSPGQKNDRCVWKPMPTWVGEEEYPAQWEEMRRGAHLAKKIARVRPP